MKHYWKRHKIHTKETINNLNSKIKMTAIVDKDWVELDTETKAAAEILGYSEAIWDGNGKVPLEDIKFDSLTKEQQAAVEKIGLEDDDWDEEGLLRLQLRMEYY